jgi:hypothetical protein
MSSKIRTKKKTAHVTYDCAVVDTYHNTKQWIRIQIRSDQHRFGGSASANPGPADLDPDQYLFQQNVKLNIFFITFKNTVKNI